MNNFYGFSVNYLPFYLDELSFYLFVCLFIIQFPPEGQRPPWQKDSLSPHPNTTPFETQAHPGAWKWFRLSYRGFVLCLRAQGALPEEACLYFGGGTVRISEGPPWGLRPLLDLSFVQGTPSGHLGLIDTNQLRAAHTEQPIISYFSATLIFSPHNISWKSLCTCSWSLHPVLGMLRIPECVFLTSSCCMGIQVVPIF